MNTITGIIVETIWILFLIILLKEWRRIIQSEGNEEIDGAL